ncbi:MAG: hypothetical protein Q8Q21_01225 [bacterium]|nr:hypothetical protein [bacterium]
MIEVKKKENESSLSLLRRFSQRVKKSGNIIRAKKLRFSSRPASAKRKKDSAIRRVLKKKEKELMRKLGKID